MTAGKHDRPHDTRMTTREEERGWTTKEEEGGVRGGRGLRKGVQGIVGQVLSRLRSRWGL